MTLKYSYLTKAGKEVGEYQCEDADFRKLWPRVRKDVRAAVVELQNGETWIYYYPRFDQGRWSKVRSTTEG